MDEQFSLEGLRNMASKHSKQDPPPKPVLVPVPCPNCGTVIRVQVDAISFYCVSCKTWTRRTPPATDS